MKSPLPGLLVEPLEDRSLPAMFGSPWPDAGALSLSFAPDSTHNGSINSALFKTLDGVANTPVWQTEVLRAFQTWAVNTNVNIGLIKDSGLDFGTPGDIQGDTRFGDIRIGADPLSGSLANTSPFSWGIGTWSGDVILNSAAKFAINPSDPRTAADLFSVALHEAGHVFGLADQSADPTSVMYTNYLGTRAGLSAADIAAVQAVYGPRTPDLYEGSGGNNTFATATPLSNTGNVLLTADIHDNSDVDVYSFVQPAGDKVKLKVATTGISLLSPDLAVYDASGALIKRLASTDVTSADADKGDVLISLDHLTTGATYYVRVAGATQDVFGIGRYQLSVSWKDTPATESSFEKDAGTNETPQTAEPLDPRSDGRTPSDGGYAKDAVLESRTDVDWYQVPSPAAADGTDQAMLVRVRSLNGNHVAPSVTVLDGSYQPLQYQVLANDGKTLTLQVLGNQRAADYYIGLANPTDGTDATGNYRLSVDFRTPNDSTLTRLMNGQLGGGAATTATGTLVVNTSRLFQCDFFTTPAGGPVGNSVTFTLRDAAGKAILTLTQTPGQAMVNDAVYLAPGAYTVEISIALSNGQATPSVNYSLYAGEQSDQQGTYATTTTGTSGASSSGPVSGSGTTTTTGAYFYTTPTTITLLGYAYTF
jgi:hypothetical protein